MAVTHSKLQIDVNESINSIVTAVSQDTGRYLDVALYENGLPINLSGHTVRIHAEKKDGTSVFNQGEITDAANGRCQFQLTNQMLAVAGNLEVQISVWGGNAEILSTAPFKIFVLPTMRDEEAVESTNEFGAVVMLFTEIQDALYLMAEITDTFGLPGSIAAGYGVNTFWGMLERVAAGADVNAAINSRVNTDTSKALNVKLDNHISALTTLLKGGNVPAVRNVARGLISFSKSENTQVVSLSGFVNPNKMIAILNGERMNDLGTAASGAGGHSYSYPPYVTSLTALNLEVHLGFWNSNESKGGAPATIGYQVIEFY